VEVEGRKEGGGIKRRATAITDAAFGGNIIRSFTPPGGPVGCRLIGTMVSATFAYRNHPQAHEVITMLGISLYQASLFRVIVSGDTSISGFSQTCQYQ
jgi:hypothetical protein